MQLTRDPLTGEYTFPVGGQEETTTEETIQESFAEGVFEDAAPADAGEEPGSSASIEDTVDIDEDDQPR